MRNVVITGGNSGLGFKTAKKVAMSRDYRVVLACRDQQRAQRAAEEIMLITGNADVAAIPLDTASLASVRETATTYEDGDFGEIYALLLNAGVSGQHGGLTEDGMDVVFQTNHLGYFLLANLLLPLIAENGRVFSTTSDMHDPPAGEMAWPGAEALAHPSGELARSRMRYSYSKLANIYFIHELAKSLEAEGSQVTANAFNPGMMMTNFANVNKAQAAVVKRTMPHRFGDLAKSSDAYARLVVDDALAVTSGNYYDRSTTAVPSSDLSYDEDNARELWVESMRLCGLQ